MKLFLFVVGWLAAVVFGGPSRIGHQSQPSYHVSNVKRTYTSDAPSHLENAMNNTMDLSFETDDHLFSLNLELNTKLYTKFTKIYSLDSNGEPYLRPRRYRSYLGLGYISSKEESGSQSKEADCSVTFYSDLRFHAVCVTSDDTYTVDLSELSKHRNGEIHGTNKGEKLLLTRASEVEQIDEHNNRRKLLASDHTGNLFTRKLRQEINDQVDSYAGQSHSRSLLNNQAYLEKFDDCFSGQTDYVHQLNIGIITDTSYNAVFSYNDDDVESSVESIFNDASGANMVYYYQLNVMITIGTMYIGNSYSGYSYSPATYASGYSINSRLDEMTNWRKEYLSKNSDDTNGLWHLLTNHHPPAGTVGLAWLSCICSSSYGTGVSNYISYSPGTWLTFAHEVGHNFGADHAFDEGQGRTGGVMDYGDGIYNNAYQFHPTYTKDDVCGQIEKSRSTSSRWYMIDLDNCWHQYSGDSGSSTNDDDDDGGSTGTGGTGTSTSTSETTGTPDTPSPTDADDSEYVWYWYGDQYTDCACEDGSAVKYKIYSCFEQETTTSGSTTYYTYTGVSDNNCDSDDYPSETADCSSELSCGTGTGTSTNDDGDDTSGSGSDDSETTAAFMDGDGNVYIFEGGYYAKYSSFSYGWSNNQADSGYPKAVSHFGVTSFNNGADITAIAYSSDSTIYVFSGLEYTKVDIDSGEYSGYPKTLSDDYNVPSAITSCGSITAATMNSGYILVFCGAIYGYAIDSFSYDYTWTYGSGSSVVALYSQNSYLYAFYEGNDIFRRRLGGHRSEGISIAELDHSSVLMKNGDFVNAGSIWNGNARQRRRLADNSSDVDCYDSNCASCSPSDTSICYECDQDYVLYGSVKCLINTTLLYLDFDVYSAFTIDHYFIEGGRDTVESFTYTFDGVTGANSTAMVFDGSTKITLTPLDYADENSYVNSFKISFRFKPTTIIDDKLISIDDDNVYISLKNNTANIKSNITDNAQYVAAFTVGNNTYTTAISSGLTIGDWNTIEMQYSEDIFKIYINGDTIEQAYSSTSDWADLNVQLRFTDWYIGDDSGNGINGEMDQLSFKVIETSYDAVETEYSETITYTTVDDSKYQTWLWIGIISILVALLFAIGFCIMTSMYCKAKNSSTKSGDDQYFRMGA